ncbi:MAG TPA: LLM class flavin-dependent oxidoreductase [Trebonia sp.]|jgi:alkanesulfonate monooxygenase SsuD/methylene tetrahydromethanopterin reductase-like flavin-dependent oxidoreductase (luciferase family)|nr:LLM class flavin-dependent oxidoreductase [Trebonia sp.]
MRFAIGIPQLYTDGSFSPSDFTSYLARVEELGLFESAWTQEMVLGPAPQLAPLEVLTYAAACTSTLRLGCTVFVTTLHTPAHLAKALASLDQLSGGRLEVGIGSGGPRRPFAAFGMSGERWLPRFTEGVALMKALWTEPAVTFDGEFWQLKDAAMEPKPYQKPYPRLWFGGSAPAAVRRGVGLCDGFFGAGSSATDAFASQVGVVRSTLAEDFAGRSVGFGPGEFPIAKRVYLGVDPSSGARARDRMNDALARMYGARVPAIEAAAVAGTVAECVDGVRAVIEAGAEMILFTPLYDNVEHLELIAGQIIPALEGASGDAR